MSKEKNRRRTPAEQAIHEEAVRLRRLTDRQLVEQFHRAAEPEMAASAQRGAGWRGGRYPYREHLCGASAPHGPLGGQMQGH